MEEGRLFERLVSEPEFPSYSSLLIDASLAGSKAEFEDIVRSANCFAMDGKRVGLLCCGWAAELPDDTAAMQVTLEDLESQTFDLYLSGTTRAANPRDMARLSALHAPRPVLNFPLIREFTPLSPGMLPSSQSLSAQAGGDSGEQPMRRDFGWRTEEYGRLLALLRYSDRCALGQTQGRLEHLAGLALERFGSVPHSAPSRPTEAGRACAFLELPQAVTEPVLVSDLRLFPVPYTARVFRTKPSTQKSFDLAACARFADRVLGSCLFDTDEILTQGQCFCFNCVFERETMSELGATSPFEVAAAVSWLRNLLKSSSPV